MNESYKIHYPSLKKMASLKYTDPRVHSEGKRIFAEKEGYFKLGEDTIHGHYVVYEDEAMPGSYIGVHIGSEINEDSGEAPINVVAIAPSRSVVTNRVAYRMRKSKVQESEDGGLQEFYDRRSYGRERLLKENRQKATGPYEPVSHVGRAVDANGMSYHVAKGKSGRHYVSNDVGDPVSDHADEKSFKAYLKKRNMKMRIRKESSDIDGALLEENIFDPLKKIVNKFFITKFDAGKENKENFEQFVKDLSKFIDGVKGNKYAKVRSLIDVSLKDIKYYVKKGDYVAAREEALALKKLVTSNPDMHGRGGEKTVWEATNPYKQQKTTFGSVKVGSTFYLPDDPDNSALVKVSNTHYVVVGSPGMKYKLERGQTVYTNPE